MNERDGWFCRSATRELFSIPISGKDTNILTEQLGQDITRVHRLELENQRLLSELENAKEKGFSEFSGKLLELEKENKRQSITIEQLQHQRKKDEDYHAQLNDQLRRSESKIKELNTVVAALKEAEEQLSIEKNTEIDNLQTQVDSMRKRQESSQNEQLAQIQEENLKLIKVMWLWHWPIDMPSISKDNNIIE